MGIQHSTILGINCAKILNQVECRCGHFHSDVFNVHSCKGTRTSSFDVSEGARIDIDLIRRWRRSYLIEHGLILEVNRATRINRVVVIYGH